MAKQKRALHFFEVSLERAGEEERLKAHVMNSDGKTKASRHFFDVSAIILSF